MKTRNRIAFLILTGALIVTASLLPEGGRQPTQAASAPGPVPLPQAQGGVEASKAKVAQTVARLKQQALAAQQQASARRIQEAEATLATLRSKLQPRPKAKLGPTVRLGQLPANWSTLVVKDTGGRPTGGPHIDRLQPTAAVVGKELTVNGARFGAAAGDVNLHIAGMTVVCPIIRWQDTEIAVTVPGGLEGVVGEMAKDARLWVNHATTGAATTPLLVGPDPSHYRPIIARVPPAIVPGELYVIEGANFLHERQGTVEFRLPTRGVTYTCSIQSWTDTLLGVRLPSHIRGIPPERGVLSLKNHLGMETTRPVTFQPLLDVEVVSESGRLDLRGAIGRDQVVLNDFILRNSWTVLDSEASDPYLRWETRPTRGSTNCRCVLSESRYGAIGIWTVTAYVTITGPRGMPYR